LSLRVPVRRAARVRDPSRRVVCDDDGVLMRAADTARVPS
jgi:hypothetical protein